MLLSRAARGGAASTLRRQQWARQFAAVNFNLADIGEGIFEVEVLEWFVKPGDKVSEFDKVCEVQSDKANVEITSPYSGVVQSLYHEVGGMAKVGQPLMCIDSDNTDSSSDPVGANSVATATETVAANSPTEVVDFNLADIGEGIFEVEVLEWFVKPGDEIQEFDKVCEVQSDKANVEITSPYAGKVESLCHEIGEMAKVGAPLMRIATAVAPMAASVSASSSQASTPSSQGAASQSTTSQGAAPASQVVNKHGEGRVAPLGTASAGKVFATPAVRRMAREYQVDLAQVKGTGPKGRVLKGDVIAFVEEKKLSSQAFEMPPHPFEMPPPVPSGKVAAADKEVPVTGLMRTMVKTMNAAAAVPTFGYADEICLDDLADLRAQLKPLASEQGVSLSFMPFIMKAVSIALREYPGVNAHAKSNADGEIERLTWKGAHNIGVAMDTPAGLIVPNVKNCESKSVLEIARELNRLQALAKKGKLGADDLRGGTLSLSNIGAIGGTYCRPILAVPEVCIGALGKIETLPRFDDDGAVVASKRMVVSWSADHRVVDGATCARFSNRMKSLLESPATMLLHLQ